MNRNKHIQASAIVLLVMLVPGVLVADSGADVDGVLGLRPVETSSCIAIWIPIPEGQALSGFLWYNNDENTVFPEVLLESGTPNQPVTLSEAQIVAQNVRGVSSGWSELELAEPVGCLSQGLYLLVRFPEASAYEADGIDGGAAVGYRTDGQGFPGWISADGQEWVAFKDDFGFALQPVFTEESNASVIMQRNGRRLGDLAAPRRQTALHQAHPNPFNPSTTLRFELAKQDEVELAVFNLRGELVNRLVTGVMSAGPHEAVWTGLDTKGRRVASGVYLARLQTGSYVMTRRLVLVQ